MPIDSSDRFGSDNSPRILLRRLREIMAAEEGAQERLDHLTEAIAAIMVADVCSIYLRRSDDQLELFSTVGLRAEAVHNTRLAWDEGLVGYVARQMQPLVTAKAPENEHFSFRPEVGEEALQSFLGVPIIRTGQVLGVLVVQNKAGRRYTEDEVEAAQMVAMVLAEIVSAGDLLDQADTEEVDTLLHRPAHFIGTPIVPGIVIGTVALHEPPLPKHKLFADDVGEEVKRLELGIRELRKSVDNMISSNQQLSQVSKEVIEVYRLFAYDKGWAKKLTDAVTSGLTAESAVEQVQAENRKRMKLAKDPYIRERLHDLDDLSRRLLRALSGTPNDLAVELEEGAVLLADALGPAEILELDRTRLSGIVLGESTDTSHAAIVARSLNIPFIGRCAEAVERAEPGDRILIDGATGDIHLRPEDEVVAAYQDKIALFSDTQRQFAALRDLASETLDGRQIDLFMNAGLEVDMAQLQATNAVGVGLFRTEFQFLIGPQLPTATEQEELYRSVLDAAQGKPVIFRTADLGSDKAASYMEVGHESNPAMGWRGLRMSIDREGLIRPQLRALIAAAAGRDLHILLPLVTTADEIDAARGIIDKELDRRRRRDRPLPTRVLVGAMIEIPAAAWRVQHIAQKVDFLSLGGNDLAQFFFAADRDSERVSNRYDPLHPGFLSFLKHVSDQANAAGKPLCYCGEQAADTVMAMALIGIGVTRLSVPSTSIGPLKRMIRTLRASDLSDWIVPRLGQTSQSLRADLSAYAERTRVVL